MAPTLRNRTRKESRITTTTTHISIAYHAHEHNTLATNLFRLPQELLDIIFEKVWASSDAFAFRYRRLWVISGHSHCTWDYRFKSFGLPRWLLSSKSILHEGLATLHRTQTFIAAGQTTKCFFDSTSPTPAKRGTTNDLLFNNRIRNVRSANKCALVPPWTDTPDLCWASQHTDRLFATYLAHVQAKPRTLVIKMDLHLMGPNSNYNAMARASPLLGLCRTVILDFRVCRRWLGTDAPSTSKRFQRVMRAVEGFVVIAKGSRRETKRLVKPVWEGSYGIIIVQFTQ